MNYYSYIDPERWNIVKLYEGYDHLLSKNDSDPSGDLQALPPYLDSGRPDYPRELAAAIEAWQFVVRLDPLQASFKKELREFLRIKGWKGGTLGRIATVANPYKDKGTPRRST